MDRERELSVALLLLFLSFFSPRVIFTIGLISFIAYTSQIFVIWPWYDRELSWELVALLGPFK